MNEDEDWRPVVGYEGRYEVSNKGRVRSLNYRQTGRKQIMKPYHGKYGYVVVILSGPRGRKTYVVSNLVMVAFSGPRPDGLEVCHGPDFTTSNNHIENLRYDTRQANMDERDNTYLTLQRGERHPNAKLKDYQRAEIVARCNNGEKPKDVATHYGITPQRVYQVVREGPVSSSSHKSELQRYYRGRHRRTHSQ